MAKSASAVPMRKAARPKAAAVTAARAVEIAAAAAENKTDSNFFIEFPQKATPSAQEGVCFARKEKQRFSCKKPGIYAKKVLDNCVGVWYNTGVIKKAEHPPHRKHSAKRLIFHFSLVYRGKTV